MRAYFGWMLFLFACLTSAASPAAAQSLIDECRGSALHRLSGRDAFFLPDPRSGLMLRVEKDGRQMSAADRTGKIIWQRKLFGDPEIPARVLAPPRGMPGPPADWVQRHVVDAKVESIGIIPDCSLRTNDKMPAFRGHYIDIRSDIAEWLMDARTGDLVLRGVN